MRLLDAVNRPRCVELLVTTVLRVDLRKHEELDIVRVARAGAGLREGLKEVVNLGSLKRKAEDLVGSLERSTGSGRGGVQVNLADRENGMGAKELVIAGRKGLQGLWRILVSS